jgi:hypothetical protein
MTNAVNIAQIGSNNVTMRNRIINGAMVIDQRNAGASVTAGSSYTLDRWNVDRVWSGSTVTIQQSSTAPAGFTNSMVATVSTGAAVSAANYFSIQQFIEGYNVADMGFGTANAQTFTVSFWVRSSVTGTFGVGFRNSAFDLSYWTTYTINSANTWEQKSVTIAGPTTGTWYTNNSYGLNLIFSLGCGSTNKAASNNAWNAGGKLGAVGETDLIATTGATFYITGVQLEAGTTASPFEYRQYGLELTLCLRYYEKTYSQGVVPGTSTESNVEWAGTSFQSLASTGTFQAQLRPFKVIKRAAPTMTFWDMVGNQGKWTRYLVGGGPNNNNTVTVDSQDDCGFRMFVAGTSSTSNATGHWTASSEL